MSPAMPYFRTPGELSVEVAFPNAARADPEVLQVVVSGLFSAEPDLVIARFALAGTID